eukprot:756447-Rhodomonas_salina.1
MELSSGDCMRVCQYQMHVCKTKCAFVSIRYAFVRTKCAFAKPNARLSVPDARVSAPDARDCMRVRYGLTPRNHAKAQGYGSSERGRAR